MYGSGQPYTQVGVQCGLYPYYTHTHTHTHTNTHTHTLTSWPEPYVFTVYQGSTLGAQIIQGGLEQPVEFSRVPRNCFQNHSGCYKISRVL